MYSFKVKLFGITVAELVCSEPEVVVRIDNTGGQFDIATDDYSPDYDDDEWVSPDDPINNSFGFGGGGVCRA